MIVRNKVKMIQCKNIKRELYPGRTLCRNLKAPEIPNLFSKLKMKPCQFWAAIFLPDCQELRTLAILLTVCDEGVFSNMAF